jgi:hypothetical protein
MRQHFFALAVVALCSACGARSSILPVEQEEDPATLEPPIEARCYSICRCISGTSVLAAPLPNADGGCLNACDGACQPHGGVQNGLSSIEGLGAIPYCDELCGRIDALGCSADRRDVIGGACEDVSPETCDTEVKLAFKCIATTSELFCDGDGIRIEFCPSAAVSFCSGG